MNEVESTISKSQPRLTLRQVAKELKYKDDLATRRWLKKNGIQIHRLAKENFVYQIEFDLVFERLYVNGLRIKHPQKWKEIYRLACKDDILFELMVMEMEESTPRIPMTKVSLRSKSDDKLYKSLLI
jgi:hypothetical protein